MFSSFEKSVKRISEENFSECKHTNPPTPLARGYAGGTVQQQQQLPDRLSDFQTAALTHLQNDIISAKKKKPTQNPKHPRLDLQLFQEANFLHNAGKILKFFLKFD